MHHLLAYYTNDLAQNAVLTALGTITDPVWPVQNGRYQAPYKATVGAFYAGIDSPTRVQIQTASMRGVAYPTLTPISGTNLPANVAPWIALGPQGPDVLPTESMSVNVSRAGAGAADAYVLLWMFERFGNIFPGKVHTVGWTAAVTIAEGTWSAGNVTLDQVLYPGLYELVGCEVYGTNCLAGRVIFPGGPLGTQFRPGVLAQGAQGEWNKQQFRFGDMGPFGRFRDTAQPMMEFLGVGAGTSQIGYWDLVRVGD